MQRIIGNISDDSILQDVTNEQNGNVLTSYNVHSSVLD